jgi:hypothetical protein
MYLKEEISQLKGDMKTAINQWAEHKIDTLVADKPKLLPVSVYLKRGLNNWLDNNDTDINSMIDTAVLFIADKSGNIDFNTVFEDAMNMFKAMEKQHAKWGIFGIEYGKGEIIINIPHNPLLDIMFGDLGQVKINTDDIMEIKDMLQ